MGEVLVKQLLETYRGYRTAALNAKVIGVITFVSRILGLVREMIIASYFGPSSVLSAFKYAFVLPNLFTVTSIFCGFYAITLCSGEAGPVQLYQAALADSPDAKKAYDALKAQAGNYIYKGETNDPDTMFAVYLLNELAPKYGSILSSTSESPSP